MNWSYIFIGIFLFFIVVQVVFNLFVFLRLLFVSRRTNTEQPSVSVIVCAWNELDNLKTLLPLLDTQDYPTYEVIVIDDRSTDGAEEYLQSYCIQSEHVRMIRIEEVQNYITPKKYAVTIAQKHARYEYSLMTDADCLPDSPNWISAMVSRITPEKKIVLGFSPYLEERGLLNWFIRCETFYTAVQYLSFALSGVAYMGVGRNLLYERDLFFKNKGFYRHNRVLGGDDDLFINEVATSSNVAVCIDPESFVYSRPKETWAEWYHQKQRHLGVGKLYRSRNKFLLGLLSGSHVMVWLLSPLFIGYGYWQQDWLFLVGGGAAFTVRAVLQWIILGAINARLGNTISWLTIPLMDFALFLYYLFIGGGNLLRKKRVAQWR